MNIASVVLACAPYVHVTTAQALVVVESSSNPYAIGVVGGVLERQPRTRGEAIATARALRAGGWDFSAGLAQINVRNWERTGLTVETVFDPCANLQRDAADLARVLCPRGGASAGWPGPCARGAVLLLRRQLRRGLSRWAMSIVSLLPLRR